MDNGKIIILEGADGTGKTILANALQEETKGTIMHSNYREEVNMEQYNMTMINNAISLSNFGDTVIIDRWAPSEEVYGNVFRDGPTYSVDKLIDAIKNMTSPEIIWIYCKNDNTVENHLKNKKDRDELYSDMTDIVEEYDKFIKNSNLNWIVYDFTKVKLDKFIGDIL